MNKLLVNLVIILVFTSTAWSNIFLENSLRFEKIGEYKQAMVEWEKAKHTFTENIFNQRLAWLEYLMGHYDVSLSLYEKAVLTNQNDVISFLGMINCYSALKNYEKACDFSSYLLKKFPDNLNVRRAASSVFYYGGKYKAQIDLALKFSNDRVINTTRGWSLYQQGKYNSARFFFKEMLKSAKTETEKKSLQKAVYECEIKEQFTLGMFYTNIQYALNLPDKRVENAVFLYSPHKWNQYRFIYGNTETSDSSFQEDSFNIGYTSVFKRNYTFIFDFTTFSSNDAYSDTGKVFSFQLLKKLSSKFTAGIEYDYSNYDQFNVSQFSPRIYYQIDRKTGLEFKTYFIQPSDNTLFSGNNQAFLLKFNRILCKNLFFNTMLWTGDKRYSVETDKSYVFNTPDVYESGYALGLDYMTKKSMGFTVGYSRNRFKSYTTGDRGNSGQWTFGMKLRN